MSESTGQPDEKVIPSSPARDVPEPGPRAGPEAMAPSDVAIPLPPPGYTERQPGDDEQLQDFDSQDG
jgi:hypothetical protein